MFRYTVKPILMIGLAIVTAVFAHAASQEVMAVRIILKSGQPVIESATVAQGQLNRRCRDVGMSSEPAHNSLPTVYIADKSGAVLHQQIFSFPVSRTVPPCEPGTPQTGPDIIPLAEPEIVLLLPWFKEAASVTVYAAFQDKPSSILDLRENPPRYIPTPAALNASSSASNPGLEDGLNIMIMASGYDNSNINQFTQKALEMKNYLLNAEPFRSFTAHIQFYVYPNLTDIGCAPGCAGIDRLLCCDSSSVTAAALASGMLFDEIIVLHHTAVYCGGGYRESLDAYKTNSYSTFCATYDGDNNKAVALHEIGHSFGNLCDEYTYGSEGYIYSPCVNCRALCSDWSSISSSCQRSCDAENQYFRPADSIMLSLSSTAFNDVSLYAQFLPDGLFKRMRFFAGEQTLIYIPITATLMHEKAWIISRDYAEIKIRFDNPSASNIDKFKLQRKTRNSAFTSIREIPASGFTGGEFIYRDMTLQKNQGYIYKVEALNASGTVIGASDETGI